MVVLECTIISQAKGSVFSSHSLCSALSNKLKPLLVLLIAVDDSRKSMLTPQLSNMNLTPEDNW